MESSRFIGRDCKDALSKTRRHGNSSRYIQRERFCDHNCSLLPDSVLAQVNNMKLLLYTFVDPFWTPTVPAGGTHAPPAAHSQNILSGAEDDATGAEARTAMAAVETSASKAPLQRLTLQAANHGYSGPKIRVPSLNLQPLRAPPGLSLRTIYRHKRLGDRCRR